MAEVPSSDSVLSEFELLDLSLEICSMWMNVGIRLGLPMSTLDGIAGTASLDTPQRKAFDMLINWRCRQTSPSHAQLQLISALELEGRLDLAARYGNWQHPGGSDVKVIGDITYVHNDVHLLGKGCKGTKVYRGRLLSTNRKIAVKRIYAELFDQKEADHLMALKHSNIIECFAVEMKEDFIYLALDLGRKTLNRCIEDNDFVRRESGVNRIECLKDITKAVEYLHEWKICHRDIKPENILMFDSVPPRFVLADFNTARESGSNESSATQVGHSIVGSLGYMAPEVYHGGKRARKQDIFSLGCVFYYTLTDKGHPFGSVKFLRKCQSDIDHGKGPCMSADFLEGVWMRQGIELMVSHDPEQRPTATTVRNVLEGGRTAVVTEDGHEASVMRYPQQLHPRAQIPTGDVAPGETHTDIFKKGSPSDQDLVGLAVNIPGEWYQLSIHLGLRKGAVDDILHDVRFARPSDKAFQALVVWRNGFADDATYERLAGALRNVDRRDLVEDFCMDQARSGGEL